MAVPTASDNIFPKLILDEGGTLGTVTAGERRLGIDANGVLVWKNSAGTTSPLVALNKWDATTAPTANEDSGDGYQVGSRWIDTTNNKEYVCVDATAAAAVWIETTASGTPTFVGVQAYKAADTTVATGTNVQLGLDNESYDAGGFHDNVTNNSRATVPTGKAGKYLIIVRVGWSGAGTGNRHLVILKNGTTSLGRVKDAGSADPYQVLTTMADLIVGDYVELRVFQDSGSNKTVFGNTSAPGESSFLSMTLIGS